MLPLTVTSVAPTIMRIGTEARKSSGCRVSSPPRSFRRRLLRADAGGPASLRRARRG
jgi:hypothetical protein